jgi:hypothetical protein
MQDELLRIEPTRIAWATLSDWDIVQQQDSQWIKAEEMQPPSIWTTTLQPIEEGSVPVLQQMASETRATAAGNEALTRKRDRSRFNVAPE